MHANPCEATSEPGLSQEFQLHGISEQLPEQAIGKERIASLAAACYRAFINPMFGEPVFCTTEIVVFATWLQTICLAKHRLRNIRYSCAGKDSKPKVHKNTSKENILRLERLGWENEYLPPP